MFDFVFSCFNAQFSACCYQQEERTRLHADTAGNTTAAEGSADTAADVATAAEAVEGVDQVEAQLVEAQGQGEGQGLVQSEGKGEDSVATVSLDALTLALVDEDEGLEDASYEVAEEEEQEVVEAEEERDEEQDEELAQEMH